jgi:hypothetical protein
MVMNKRGSEKYYILISMILGLIILTISLFFIFNEYFTQNELNLETCRQSVVLRNLGFEAERPITSFLEVTKDMVPLKCKNEVVTLDIIEGDKTIYDSGLKAIIIKEENKETVIETEPLAILGTPNSKGFEGSASGIFAKIMADKMVRCWNLMGDGEYRIFPTNFADARKDCLICTRIHFSEKFKTFMGKLPGVGLSASEVLLNYDVNGKKLDPSERGGKKSMAFIMNVRFASSKFEFLDSGNWGKNRWSQGYGDVSPVDGDVLVGVYFYSNREFFDKLAIDPRNLYRTTYPFYAQPEKDDISKCVIHSIPA